MKPRIPVLCALLCCMAPATAGAAGFWGGQRWWTKAEAKETAALFQQCTVDLKAAVRALNQATDKPAARGDRNRFLNEFAKKCVPIRAALSQAERLSNPKNLPWAPIRSVKTGEETHRIGFLEARAGDLGCKKTTLHYTHYRYKWKEADAIAAEHAIVARACDLLDSLRTSTKNWSPATVAKITSVCMGADGAQGAMGRLCKLATAASVSGLTPVLADVDGGKDVNVSSQWW